MAAAAYNLEEEQFWKCPKHPSKRRRHGICSTCLRDRLVSLCPNCGSVRPCSCVSAANSSSSSSSSSSSDLSLRRSRSLAIPFLRSNTARSGNTPTFLSVFRRSKTKKSEEKGEDCDSNGDDDSNKRIEDFAMMITRSRSARAGTASGSRRSDVVSSSPNSKSKFWQFPSRMKAFRTSKTPKAVAQDRSPLHRG